MAPRTNWRVCTATHDDLDAFGAHLRHAFNTPPESIAAVVERVGLSNIRMVHSRSAAAGCACLIPMGQYFGQRSVSTMGIAGVAVGPTHARQGAATELMRSVLRELATSEVALSTLYASTLPLYRGVGFECAGSRFVGRAVPKMLGVRESGGTFIEVDEPNERRIKALYGAHGPAFNGHLDRGDYIWHRLIRPWAGQTPYVLLLMGEHDQAEGYISYVKSTTNAPYNRIIVKDMFAISGHGYRRLWSFLSDVSTSVVDSIEFNTAPHDPARLSLPDPHFDVTLTDCWMVRIANVQSALSQRGYAPRVNATLDLDLYDDVIDANNGKWRLTIRGGRGTVARGGTGALRADMRGLAALYTGFVDAGSLAAMDRLHGTPAALAIASAVFGGPQPWMREMF